MRAFFLPLCDCHQVLGLFLLKEMHPVLSYVPAETEIWDLCPEGDELGGFPLDSQVGQDFLDVGVHIEEHMIVRWSGGRICHVDEGRTAVLVKFLWRPFQEIPAPAP